MTPDRLLELILAVLTSREVIVVTVAIALYVNVVNYIVHYRKRPPAPRKKRRAAPAPAAANAEGEPEITEDEGK